jgi:head-tail adaptor
MTTLSAGTMYHAFTFDELIASPDGYGGVKTQWTERFTTRAMLMNLRGSERVISARLEGVQPVVVKIRASTAASAVNPAWRMRDARSDRVYNVRSIVLSDDRRFLEITADSSLQESDGAEGYPS